MLIFALNIICWVRIVQRVGYEMSEPGYESSGYERSMGTKRLDTNRSRFSKYYMTGSPVFSINFTNQSINNSQAILKCFIDLKSSVWFTLVSDFRSIKHFRIA